MKVENSWFDKSRIRTIVIFLISFVFIYLDSINQNIFKKTKSVINDTIAYTSFVITYPVKKILEVPSAIQTIIYLKDQNDQISILQQKIEELKLQNDFLIKNQRSLDAFLKTETPYQSETVQAKIISNMNSIFSNSFIINKGSEDGIKQGNPIVINNNLIGQVSEVNLFSSRAIFLTDINSRVPVVIGEEMYQAILVGSPLKKNKLSLEFLPKNYQFKNNDKIFTSDIDGILKKGIAVGTIEIKNNDTKNYFIELNYEPKQIQYVSVYLN